MPHTEKLNDLHGRTMVNIISGETFHIYDKNSSRLPKPSGWFLSGRWEMNSIASYLEPKAGSVLRTGAHVRVEQLAFLRAGTSSPGEFHYIGKEASARWAGGPDPSSLADAGALDPADETCRE